MPFYDYGGFGQDYFEGRSVATPHPAGYSTYDRSLLPFDWYGRRIREVIETEGVTAAGSKVLIVGCAYGYSVEYSIDDWNIDAYGMDVSTWAVGQADTATAYGGRISTGDATVEADIRDATPGGPPAVILNECVLECLTDAEAQTACANMRKRAQSAVIHRVWTPPRVNADYYNAKTLADWQALCDPDGQDRWYTDADFQPV